MCGTIGPRWRLDERPLWPYAARALPHLHRSGLRPSCSAWQNAALRKRECGAIEDDVRRFDFRAILPNATPVGVLRLAVQKSDWSQGLAKKSPNSRSHQVRRIIGRESNFWAKSRRCGVQPFPHNPRKQRKNPAAAGSGERFRGGKWRRDWAPHPTFFGSSMPPRSDDGSTRDHYLPSLTPSHVSDFPLDRSGLPEQTKPLHGHP
jgi:hypothetical protein